MVVRLGYHKRPERVVVEIHTRAVFPGFFYVGNSGIRVVRQTPRSIRMRLDQRKRLIDVV